MSQNHSFNEMQYKGHLTDGASVPEFPRRETSREFGRKQMQTLWAFTPKHIYVTQQTYIQTKGSKQS